MKLRWLVAGILCGLAGMTARAGQSLAERLGYPADARLLIVNGDDAGMCHTANVATIESLEHGLMTSSTVLVPCPWFLEIARYAKEHPARDFGVHLCQTSEWQVYRWGPVAPRSDVPNLVDPDGYFWHEAPQVYAKGNPQEAYVEARAQVKKALEAGIDVTHLDSHMGVLQLNPAYVEKYLQLAVDFDLPVRMGSQASLEKNGGAQMRAAFAARGILMNDDFVWEDLADEPKDVKGYWMRKLASLRPGVTELFIHAGHPTDELKAITHSWAVRSAEFEAFTRDPEVRALVESKGIIRIGWRPIRELQRKERRARAEAGR